MRIYELYSSLDIDERSPLALQTMGAAGGQTIVGAFSTGTHGGDVLFPPLADYVVAIHMIALAFAAPLLRDTPLSERTPYAAEFWIERGDDPDVPPLVDEGLLQAVYPQLPEAAAPITVLRDNDLFDAVRVSAGRMGLIYSVVLRVGWQYCLEQVRTKDTWSNVKTWINEPANQNFPQPTPSNPLPVDHRFVQVVVNPNAQPLHSGEHTCYVTYHNKKAVGQSPRGRYERRGPRLQNTNPPEFQNAGTTAPIDQPAGLFTLPCSSSSPLKTFVGTLATASLGAAAAAIGAAALSTDEGNFVEASADILAAATATTAAVALGTASALIQSGPLGDAVGSICNWCAQNNQFEIVREIEEYVLSTQQKLEDITAISYAILDTHDYTDQGCDVNIDSLEVFFDASSQTAGMPLLIIYVEKIFQRIAELEQGAAWANGTPQAFAGYIGLRFMSSSKGLIAMQRWAYTCSMEIAGFNKVDSTKPFLTQIEKDALERPAFGSTRIRRF
jgi:hypothetical protein